MPFENTQILQFSPLLLIIFFNLFCILQSGLDILILHSWIWFKSLDIYFKTHYSTPASKSILHDIGLI